MEKRTPHRRLGLVKRLLALGNVRLTFSAVQSARALGFDEQGVINVIAALEPQDFRKSMTTYSDHRLWQDVYCPLTSAGRIYLKLSIDEGLLVVSFKEA